MTLLQRAGLLMYLNGSLHILITVLSLFSAASLPMAVVGIAYLAFGWGLSRDWRWLAYLVFIIVSFGAIVAYAMAGSTGFPISAVYWAIMGVDLLVAVTLFLALWRARPSLELS